jgi:hypothetical protein
VASEIPIMEVSEIPIRMVVSETVTADSEMVIPEVSETVIPEVSEIHSLTEDSVILHHKQDRITIISSHSQDITIITEASDLMTQEVSDQVVASTPVEAASEAVLQEAVAE